MGWFAKINELDKSDMEKELTPDNSNPFTRGIEDEGELVTIVHTRNIVPLEDEEENEDGETSSQQRLSE